MTTSHPFSLHQPWEVSLAAIREGCEPATLHCPDSFTSKTGCPCQHTFIIKSGYILTSAIKSFLEKKGKKNTMNLTKLGLYNLIFSKPNNVDQWKKYRPISLNLCPLKENV
jgi:hypothetical protein